MTPFDIINNVFYTKNNLEWKDIETAYVPFIINRGIGNMIDCVMYANEMNLYNTLSKNSQYLFYLNIIPPRKRFAKWYKKQNDSELDMIRTYYNYSYEKARAVLPLLTLEQKELIKKKLKGSGKWET
jgi:hypothetical protein